jgi:hypothetical protein
MGSGAAPMQPDALWPQLDLLVGDVLAAANWLAQDRHPGTLPLPFAIFCCALPVAPRAQRCIKVVMQ